RSERGALVDHADPIYGAHRPDILGEGFGQLDFRLGDVVPVAPPRAVDEPGDLVESELLRVKPVELRCAQAMHKHRGRARGASKFVEPQRTVLPGGIKRPKLLADPVFDLALKRGPLRRSFTPFRLGLRVD